MNTSVFKGSATAIITPMNMDGSISYKTFMPRILGTTINETYMGHDWVFSCLP